MVIGAHLLMAPTAALLEFTKASESAVLCARMAFAGLFLTALFGRRRTLNDWRQPGAAIRLLAVGVVSALTLWAFFIAVRASGVAVGMVLLFMMPVWVAVVAPPIFGLQRDRIVLPAVLLALVGLLIIIVPDVLAEGLRVTAWGVAFGLASGLGYAVYTLLVKSLTWRVSSATVTQAEAVIVAVMMLPLAWWQSARGGYHLSLADVGLFFVMGVICTAVPYTMWVEAACRVRVEHVAALGFVEPVAAPMAAYLLLRQLPTGWQLAGGLLILIAGFLVVWLGRTDGGAVAKAEPL